jgi:hypothetical protein
MLGSFGSGLTLEEGMLGQVGKIHATSCTRWMVDRLLIWKDTAPRSRPSAAIHQSDRLSRSAEVVVVWRRNDATATLSISELVSDRR